MRQVLFTLPILGGVKIFGYGLMLFFAFLGSMNLAAWRARREKLDPEVIYDLALWVFVGGLVGARLFYVIQYWGVRIHSVWDVFKVWEGGIVLYGSIMGGAAAFFLYRALRPFPLRPMLDVIAPSLALGIALGRLGCFLNGCCYGAPTSLPWACQFHDPPVTGPLTPPSHPTQIDASLASLVIFGLLMGVFRRQRVTGQVLWSYLLLYAVYRFAIEFLRKGATAEVMGALLTGAQWASVTTALVAGAALIHLSRRPKETSAEPGSGTAKNTPGQASPRTPVGASKK
jgi:phosphatidylglycerol---prolipoprotein diacylglyceryl transferase